MPISSRDRCRFLFFFRADSYFFPSALADDRYADINLLALILRANIAFASSIYVLKITLTNVKSQF